MNRSASQRTRVWLGLGLAVPVVMISCGHPTPPTAPGSAPAPGAPAVEAPNAATGKLWSRAFDVDPFHAAAFPSVEEVVPPPPMPFAADVTAVSQDLEAGRTHVTLRLDATGDDVADLRVEAGSALTPEVQDVEVGEFPGRGPGREVTLTIPNPTAASFTLNVAFTGRVAAGASQYRLMAVPIATASSSLAGYGPERSVDGNLATEWASGGYREAQATLTLDLGASQAIAQLKTKQTPLGTSGPYYQIEVSGDGAAYTAVTGQLRNATWGLETRTLPAGTTGRYVRLHFFNSTTTPATRFSVFENQVVSGSTSPSPTPGPSASPTTSPSTSPSTSPAPTPTPTPPAGSGLIESFESYALGADPSAFIDPLDEGYSYSWMPRVRWLIASQNGSKQYKHDGLATRAYLSFRRYRGGALGTSNGLLPSRYFAEVKVTPLQSYTYSPTGDQGTQIYYINPTNYVEVLIKPNMFEVWQATNAQPFTSTGWQRLFWFGTTTVANQARWLGAEVNLGTGTFTAYLDRVQRTSVRSSQLTVRNHWLALRGTGNIVCHDDLRIAPR